jgi:hypothetical protein
MVLQVKLEVDVAKLEFNTFEETVHAMLKMLHKLNSMLRRLVSECNRIHSKKVATFLFHIFWCLFSNGQLNYVLHFFVYNQRIFSLFYVNG